MTIEDLREELREDSRRLETKLDQALRDQGRLATDVATNKASTAAAHARVGRIEKHLGVIGLGIIAAAAAFVWDKATGKHQ